MTKLAFLPNRKESECSKILKNLFSAKLTGLFNIKILIPSLVKIYLLQNKQI